MEDYELTLFDRLNIIRDTNKKYDLEHNAYISFSGGKDSTILSTLIDLAIPNNKIPRVFINTGIEYNDIVQFVKDKQSKDNRFVMINPTQAIKPMLEKNGYPIKSKQHSRDLGVYQRNGRSKTVLGYLGEIKSSTKFKCPDCLKYQFSNEFKIKASDKCCYKMKKISSQTIRKRK